MKKTLSVLLTLLMLAALCGCGSSASPSAGYQADEVKWAAAPAAEQSSAYGGFAMTEDTYYDAGEMEAPYPEPNEDAGSGTDALPDIDPEKIIYSGDATVETTEFDATLARLEELIASVGGFVESSSLNGSNYYSQARGSAAARSADY